MTTNVYAVLNCLPATTTEIAIAMKLHRKTVVRIIQAQIAAGKVRVDGLQAAARGRPAEVYELTSVTVSRKSPIKPKREDIWKGSMGHSPSLPKRHHLMSLFG